MPNRIIKDSIVVSKNVSSLTDFQFRLWVHLIVFVDDYGRGNADPYIVKGMLFPRAKSISVAMVDQGMKDLAEKDLIRLYEAEGEAFFYFPNWNQHQRIRTKRSRFPSPTEENTLVAGLDSNLRTDDSKMSSNTIQSNPNQYNQSIKTKDKYGGQNFEQKVVNFSELKNIIE